MLQGDKPGDEPTDITPKEFAVRTLTQEYGGGAFRISSDDTLVFSNYKDQRLYKQNITDKCEINSNLFQCKLCVLTLATSDAVYWMVENQIHLRGQLPLIMVDQLLLMQMESLMQALTVTLLLGKVGWSLLFSVGCCLMSDCVLSRFTC